jgi:hypothetical protein
VSLCHVGYITDSYEFGSDNERRTNRKHFSEHIQLYDVMLAGITSTSARTLQKAKPLVGSRSRAVKRNEDFSTFRKTLRLPVLG